MVAKILLELCGLVTSLLKLCDRLKDITGLCDTLVSIFLGLSKFRGVFGYTAARAWVYRRVSVTYYNPDISVNNAKEILRAPSEATRPLLLEQGWRKTTVILLPEHLGVRILQH